jgi:hypothetical protein
MEKTEKKVEKNTPVKKIRFGAVVATIWENSTKEGDATFNSISLDRLYKDAEDAWKSTSSMRTNDLPKATLAMQKAYEWILTERQKAGETA